jgi:DNA repair protein RadD
VNRWPNQIRALEETAIAITGGARRLCVTSPTGTGKTTMMIDLIEWAAGNNKRVALFTNRRMLFDQTCKVLESHGIEFGRQAAGHELAYLRQTQVCMSQTVLSRGHKGDLYDLILVDELHNQGGDGLKGILAEHLADGSAAMVGYTATPLDIGDMADELIVAGTVSEGRACGALVPAHTYGPDEPDLRVIKKYRIGDDLSEGENRKVMMRPGVFSRVYENWQKLNPDWKPTILFAPDVAGSIFFAEEFTKHGVRAAHIDGDKIWLDGELHESNQAMRDELARLSENGEVPIVCNRFVLREGINWPWLQHGVLACVFGSLTSYLQSCGRLLRNSSGKASCMVQDHGGNWWRHGSINADREWSLGETNNQVVSNRIEKLRQHKEPEPIHCPKCHAIRLSGAVCKCGYAAKSKSRVVVQVDGTLREYHGDIIKPRKTSLKSDTQRLWEAMYFRMKRANRTFRQAEGLFFHENRYWPPRDLPLMPKNDGDWSRKVSDVPRDLLRREMA